MATSHSEGTNVCGMANTIFVKEQESLINYDDVHNFIYLTVPIEATYPRRWIHVVVTTYPLETKCCVYAEEETLETQKT